MMRAAVQTVVALAVAVCCASCAQFSSGSRLVLTEKDSGRTLDVEVGDTITLRLPANPSTGYLWSSKLPDMGILREVENRYETPEKSRGVAGAPVIKVYSFAVVGPGETGIKMEYRRPWEVGSAPEATFDVLIRAAGTSSLLERLDRTETPRVGSKGQIEPRR